jgi:hypothetical protein
MMDKEKMPGFMMDMCCTGMSDEDRQKVKDMCKDMAGQFPSCRKKMDISSFMKNCFPDSAAAKPRT